jgi:S-adenosylmethionine/arginine decarboxylase-like enzyme
MLKGICRSINMEPLEWIRASIPVEVAKLGREPFEDEGGASVVVLISTSSIGVHGWPAREPSDPRYGYNVVVSVVSCRGFDPGVVRALVSAQLEVHEYREAGGEL